MPGPLDYAQYYQEQMSFLVSHIENQPLNAAQQTRAQRIKNNLAKQVAYFTDDFLAITPGNELLTTRIGYVPPNGSNITLLAPDKNQANAYRHLTRQRLVYGPVDFYLDSQFATPTEIPIITTCAINLMGTSPHDSANFNPNGVFNTVEYQKECDKLADFIVSAAIKHGHDRLVMPAFGVGLYIQTLAPASQDKARELMYKAFAQAAQKQQLQVDWIVWAKDPKKNQLQQQLSALSNPYINPIIHEDFLQYGQELLANNVNAVLLNAGSDRTVGGKYTANKGRMDKLPVEEQMTQQSDLALLHTEYNKVMADNFKKQVAARRMQVAQPKPRRIPATAPYTPLSGGNDDALAIKNYLGAKEHPWIYSNGTDYKISFKSPASAQSLVNKGQNLGLRITQEGSYYAIYLSASLYQHLKQQAKQTAPVHHSGGQPPSPPKPIVIQPSKPYTHLQGGIDNALAIKSYLGINEHPWIYSNGTDYKISFKNQASAQALVDKGNSLNLKVTQEGTFYGVVLKANQYKSLMQNIKQPVLVPHQDLGQPPPRPSKISGEAPRSSNELMISAVKNAVKKYQEWYRGKADHRGPNGFFSWLRHGATGQRRATDLVAQITRKGADIEGIVNNLLKNPSTAYHRHSLSSFLLDELRELKDSTWDGLVSNEKHLYEQQKVVAHLERTSQGMQSQI